MWHICEWRSYSGVGLQICDSPGVDYHEIEGVGLFRYYCIDVEMGWKLTLWSDRSNGGIGDFRLRLISAKYEIAVMITQSAGRVWVCVGGGDLEPCWFSDAKLATRQYEIRRCDSQTMWHLRKEPREVSESLFTGPM